MQWPEEQYELLSRHKCQHPSGNLSQPAMGAIDELSCQSNIPFDAGASAGAGGLGLSRSRLKLTRITRQLQPQPQTVTTEDGAATVAAAAASARGATGSGKVRKAKAKTLKTSNTLKGLRAKLNWRGRHKDDTNGAIDHGNNVGHKSPSSAVSTERALY